MNYGTRDQRAIRLGNLAEQFDHNLQIVEKFTLFSIVQNNRRNKNLFHQTNNHSVKETVSAFLTCNEANKLFSVNRCGVKVNAQTYKRYLKKELLAFIQRLFIQRRLFILKTRFLCKTMHHHIVKTLYKIFHKKHSILVLLKHVNFPPSLPPFPPHPPSSPDYYFIID